MKNKAFRAFQIVLALVALFAGFAIYPMVVAVAHGNPWMAYFAHFGAYMFLSGLVFVVLLPAGKNRETALPFLQRWLKFDGDRFSQGFWPRFRRRGPFVFVLVCALAINPVFAAIAIRFLGLEEQKAWIYSFLTTLISSLIVVSILVGAVGLLRSSFGCSS